MATLADEILGRGWTGNAWTSVGSYHQNQVDDSYKSTMRYKRMMRHQSGHLTTSDIDTIKRFIKDRTKDAETPLELEYLNKLWWKLDSVYINALDRHYTQFTVENTNDPDTSYGILSTESAV